jgi:hypothetical protein
MKEAIASVWIAGSREIIIVPIISSVVCKGTALK